MSSSLFDIVGAVDNAATMVDDDDDGLADDGMAIKLVMTAVAFCSGSTTDILGFKRIFIRSATDMVVVEVADDGVFSTAVVDGWYSGALGPGPGRWCCAMCPRFLVGMSNCGCLLLLVLSLCTLLVVLIAGPKGISLL